MYEYESIYPDHLEEFTYRFAITYLIEPDTSPTRDAVPVSVEEQRQHAAEGAKELQSLVVAEFIHKTTGDSIHDDPGFRNLVEFVDVTHPSALIIARPPETPLTVKHHFEILDAMQERDVTVHLVTNE